MVEVDLRSDTITLPKPEMLEAITQATLGDDILREDPTVKELEEKVAEMLGMESALLVTSGTMANQIAIMSYCRRGEEVIMGEDSHIYTLEGAAASAVAQVQIKPMKVNEGVYDIPTLVSLINKGDIQRAKTSLICIENTYDLNNGYIVPRENLQAIRQVSIQYDIPVYLDGARLFNASVELGVSPATICQEVDAVQFCLTKGLGCPIGSMLAGSKEFIDRAILNRQRLGGGMRQAGIIAAPALYALEHMIDRLHEDNSRAKELGKRLSTLTGIRLDPEKIHTNIVSPELTVDHWNAELLINFLKEKGIKIKKIGNKKVRMVIHYQVTDKDIREVAQAFESFVNAN